MTNQSIDRSIHLSITHTHTLNGPLSETTWVSQYQKGKISLDFTEARDSEWQWHQLDHIQVCTSLQTDNHASTSPLSFLQAGCPSCRPTNSIKALKAPCSSSSSTWCFPNGSCASRACGRRTCRARCRARCIATRRGWQRPTSTQRSSAAGEQTQSAQTQPMYL